MSSLQHLTELLESELLYPVFQPIIDTAGQVIIGYEALIRGPAGHPLEFPDALFTVAQQLDMLSELELACRAAAIKAFLKLDTSAKLFLNVNPNVLQDDDHPHGSTLRLSKQLGIDPNRIVIELSERYPINEPELLKTAVNHYRSLGFMVAIDDLGAGYSGLKLWSEIKPDFVKIDRYFISELNNDSVKRDFVASILALAQKVNAKVIAEGIETLDEFHELHRLKLFLCQGYLFAKPSTCPRKHLELKPLLPVTNSSSNSHTVTAIASLARSAQVLSPNDKAHVALELFNKNKVLCSIPIVTNGKPLGMLRRESLMELFSGSYGRALYANKDVSRIMDTNPVIVDLNTPLATVSNIITDDDEVDVFREFIVTENQQYFGVASVRDLLKQITELRIQNARYANPLTLLPGNVPIHKKLDQQLQSGDDFAIAYFDINHFKPFNDNYGYAQGDEIIRLMAKILRAHTADDTHFIGHIGGDDFVVIFNKPSTAEQFCERIVAQFDAEVAPFYHHEDQQRGYIYSIGRDGEQQHFPLASLAVGLVVISAGKYNSHHQIATLASHAKRKAKQKSSSHCFVNYC